MKEIDKIAFICLKDRKVLSTLTKGKDTYYLPGGKREGSETDNETLIRECKEELGIDIIEDSIKYYGTFKAQAHGKEEGVFVKVTCYMAEYYGEIKASSEIQEVNWLNCNDFDKISLANKLVFEDLKQKELID